MSPLTKAFVVLVTVLSVVLVALVVPYVAKTQDYTSQIRGLEKDLQVAQNQAATAQQEKDAIQEGISKETALLNQRIVAMTKETSDLRTQADEAKSQVLKLERELQQGKLELSRFSAAAEQDANLLTVTTADLKQTRQNLVDAQTKLVQLGDRNNELESQRDSLSRQVRRLGEKMVSLEQDNVELRGLLAKVPEKYRQAITTGEVASSTIEPAVAIAGVITDVEDAAGTQLVQVDVGSKDGVEANMKFLVHRGPQYVGTFIVDKVESAASAGRITLSEDAVQSGDQIYAGPY